MCVLMYGDLALMASILFNLMYMYHMDLVYMWS